MNKMQILKRFLSILVLLSILILQFQYTATVYAENKWEPVTLTLSSMDSENETIDLYISEDRYFITIEDLCALTRSTYNEQEDGSIMVVQGFWGARFYPEKQLFDDDYQQMDIPILEVEDHRYAVPALMFLNYFNSDAAIKGDTLIANLPEFTAWEALDVNLNDTLFNADTFFGGNANVNLLLVCDILLECFLGDMKSGNGYCIEAFNEASGINLDDYSSIATEKDDSFSKLYEYLNSIEGTDCTDLIKDTVSFSGEPTEWVIQNYYRQIRRTYVQMAYDAFYAGDKAAVKQYGEKFYDAFKQENLTSSNAKGFFDNIDYLMVFLSICSNVEQQMKYTADTNDLVSRVMGKENTDYLGLNVENNNWFTLANSYNEIIGASLTQLETEATNLFLDKALWESMTGFVAKFVAENTKISDYGEWALSLNLARSFAKAFPITSDDIKAQDDQLKALYLSELQLNVCWITLETKKRFEDNWADSTLYEKYISALQLYCRTTIALYENLLTVVTTYEKGEKKEYLTTLFQSHIDELALSLYQLTMLQYDRVSECLPLELSSFQEIKANEIEDYDSFWEQFVEEEGYYEHIPTNYNNSHMNYTIADVNQDQIPELLIYYDEGSSFYTTWLFVIEDQSAALVFETYGYGLFRYSSTQNALLVSPEFKPFSGTSYSPFYRLRDNQLEFAFGVGQDMGESFYSDGSSNTPISDSERENYFSDAVHFDWRPI